MCVVLGEQPSEYGLPVPMYFMNNPVTYCCEIRLLNNI